MRCSFFFCRNRTDRAITIMTGLPCDAADGRDGGREGAAARRPRVRHAGPLRDPAAAAVPLEVGRREGQRSQHPRRHRQLGRPVPAGAGLPQGGGQRRQVKKMKKRKWSI